jgi:phage gp45-like
MGVQNNQNIGFYGGPGGWGFTYDAINSRVGIGNNNPNAPLAFPALTGKKITLFPGGLGNVGLGVYNNEFRIHTDYEPADITFGYENTAGNFTERFRFKGNGAFAVNGNTGGPGQVLQSNGNALAATWVSKPNAPYVINHTQFEPAQLNGPGMMNVNILGLNNQFFTLPQAANIVFTVNVRIASFEFVTASFGYVRISILNAGNQVVATAKAYGSSFDRRSYTINAIGTVNLPAGTYHTQVVFSRDSELDGNMDIGDGVTIIQVYPN